MKYFVLIFCSFGMILSINAQTNFDCIDAIQVCNSETSIVYADEANGVIDESYIDYCIEIASSPTDLESNTIWFRYEFDTDGDFLFEITAVDEFVDIDFVVFRSESNTCDNLQSIRCMFSGEIIGFPSEPCVGSTGLSLDATDFVEGPGCSSGDDNFLAPVEVAVGDIIYMAVRSFSGGIDFSIEYGGTAIMSCEPSAVVNKDQELIKMYPNPMESILQIENANQLDQNARFEMYDVNGKRIVNSVFSSRMSLDVEDLPKGVYFAKVVSSDRTVFTKKLVRLN